jgi:2-phosphosulfolactate phosphatase
MQKKNKIDVCLSPALYPFYELRDNIVVVIDVIRASSSICTALANGAVSILPLTSIEEALEWKQKGFLTAGERDSFKVDGFDFGNTPMEFTSNKVNGQNIAFTTTNGTNSLYQARNAKETVVGTFVNFQVLTSWLEKQDLPILFLCSGWKNTVSIEDALFAGKVAYRLLETGKFEAFSETVDMSVNLWKEAEPNTEKYILEHSPRLKSKISFLGDEIKYCLSDLDLNVIPVLDNSSLIKMNRPA